MFTLSNRKEIDSARIAKIIKNIDLADFLCKCFDFKDIVLCPSHAIDIVNASIIQSNCIYCGLCWFLTNNVISFDQVYTESVFIDFCKKNKMFLYAWLSLVIKEHSGIEIFSSGYSRKKRIPLVVLDDENKIYFIRVCLSTKNIEKAYAELEDTIDLNKSELSSYTIKKLIIVFDFNSEDESFLCNFQDCIFLDVRKILNSVLLQNTKNMTKIINLCRC